MAFAGLFKLAESGVIKPDDVVVVNCSGHTFPVEKHLLDEGWARSLNLDAGIPTDQQTPDFPPPQEEGILASLERLDGRVKSVAIIEDEPDAARLLRRIIQARGSYQVFEATNGRQGLDLIRRERPDLVLLDLGMPGMGGRRCLDGLMDLDPQVRVIVASGYADEGLESEVREAGARKYLKKPYQLSEMAMAVRAVLDA